MTNKTIYGRTDLASFELEARRLRAETLASGVRHLRGQIAGAFAGRRARSV